MTSPILTLKSLQAARAERYRQRPHLRVHTQEEALSFLNGVGICLLFSAKDLELPSLWGALCGEDRPLPRHHDDRELGLAWRWKDELPVARKVLYGKFLRKKPVFISLDLAPNFYELQMDWRIAKVAISDANRWGYCYVYDLLPRHFSGVVQAAHEITGRQARETILLRYLQTVVAATPREVVKLFGWQPGDVDRLAARLADEGQLRSGVRIEGLQGEHLVSAA
jgi:hypothetical protein